MKNLKRVTGNPYSPGFSPYSFEVVKRANRKKETRVVASHKPHHMEVLRKQWGIFTEQEKEELSMI